MSNTSRSGHGVERSELVLAETRLDMEAHWVLVVDRLALPGAVAWRGAT